MTEPTTSDTTATNSETTASNLTKHGESSDTAPGFRRRSFLKGTGVLAATGLAGCGDVLDDEDTPIRVGIIAPQAGVYEFMGDHMEQSANLLEEHVNDEGGVLDTEVEFHVRNGEGEPEASADAARQLVQRDEVDYLAGNSSTAAALAVSEYAQNQQMFYNVLVSTSRTLTTGENCNRYTFKNSPHTHQIGSFGGEWTVNNVGTDVYMLYPDYVYGEAVNDSWSTTIEENGGTVVGTDAAPLGTDDFTGIIDRVRGSDADVIIQGFAGGDGIAFYQQAEVEGLTDRPIVAPAMLAPVGAAVPPSVTEAIDIYGMLFYDRGIDTPQNNEFVNSYIDEFNLAPEFAAAWTWIGCQNLFAAIEEAGTRDTEDVIDAYEQTDRETLVGRLVQRDCDHQGQAPFHIGELTGAEEVGDAPMPTYNYVAETDGMDLLPDCADVDCQM